MVKDLAIVLDKYEDLKSSLKDSEFCKTTHEANLVDYQKEKSKLNLMVADFKKTRSSLANLEKAHCRSPAATGHSDEEREISRC